jgi:hypothetical protein
VTVFTRRTHVVRCKNSDGSAFIDVEVLDAVSFRTTQNKEVVLSLKNDKAVPFINDDTGDGNAVKNSNPTRLSHMKRVTNPNDPTQFFDVEVLDVISFRDANGGEWILDMPTDKVNVFDTTDDSGSTSSTRRTHTEKISANLLDPKPTSYLSVQRCDMIAFRSVNGRELVIKCPSNDDPLSSSPRAKTFITPQGYDPTNPNGPTPPDNKDPNTYVAFPKGSAGALTGDAKIAQGPLWWIRNISGGGDYILIVISATNVSPTTPGLPSASIDFGSDQNGATLIDEVDIIPPPVIFPGLPNVVYFIWNAILPFPTVDNFDSPVVPTLTGSRGPYGTQFVAGPVYWGADTPSTVWDKGPDPITGFEENGMHPETINPPPGGAFSSGFIPAVSFGSIKSIAQLDPLVGESGLYDDFASAVAAAAEWNSFWASRNAQFSAPPTLFAGTDLTGNRKSGGISGMFAASLDLGNFDVSAKVSIVKQFLVKVPKTQNTTTIDIGGLVAKFSNSTAGNASVSVYSLLNQPGTPTKVSDFIPVGQFAPPLSPDASAVTTQNTTFTVTTEVVPGVNPGDNPTMQITINGGGGGGGIS